MTDDEIRAALTRFWTDVKNLRTVQAIYHPNAILEFPQSGERMVGLANILAMRQAYPADVTLTLCRISGEGAHWSGSTGSPTTAAPPITASVWSKSETVRSCTR